MLIQSWLEQEAEKVYALPSFFRRSVSSAPIAPPNHPILSSMASGPRLFASSARLSRLRAMASVEDSSAARTAVLSYASAHWSSLSSVGLGIFGIGVYAIAAFVSSGRG